MTLLIDPYRIATISALATNYAYSSPSSTSPRSERAGLSGISNATSGTFAAKFRPTYTGAWDGGEIFSYATSGGSAEGLIELLDDSSLYVRWRVFGGAHTALFDTFAGSVFPAFNDDAWNTIMLSFNAPAGLGKLYVNNVDVTGATTIDTLTPTFPYSSAASKVCTIGGYDGLGEYNGCIARVLFDTRYVDLSSASNRNAILALGPTDDGSTVFGSAALMYVPDGKTVNNGTGGNLTAYNSPSACASNPP